MVDFGKDFWDAQRLLTGTIYESINEFETFVHIRSFLDDAWYNFIVPKAVTPGELDIAAIENIAAREAKDGKKMGYYIHSSLKDVYLSWLNKRGLKDLGDDLLMLKAVSTNVVAFPAGYELTTHFDNDEVGALLVEAFPTWPNESKYFKRFIKYKEEGQPGRDFIDYVVTYEGEPVGSCSMVVDCTEKIAYIHNSGVAEEHRRKGLFTSLIKACENYSLERGVDRVTCLVDRADDSFPGFKKLGYSIAADFKIYAKE